MEELQRRLYVSASAFLLVLTLVTVTTFGLESLRGFSETSGTRLFTSILLVLGIGSFLYFASSLTALILEGDATDDDVLLRAGIERARALIAALTAGKDNLYVVVTARQANPRLRVVPACPETAAPVKAPRGIPSPRRRPPACAR